ncbi:MAG: tRNA (N6-threonylcarbamoyladenosine(37)-N6)-methyltransferase TrmO [Clostridia bacterium]|nr:tRNA (N6-threonylcarbamoyladenosine(37)-N6)-methyltransferase TrmO [Clostridia bacterium]
MKDIVGFEIIAHIHSDFPSKFGIPRQSSLSGNVARIVFEKEYRVEDALRGIEGYSHLWLIWKFSECEKEGWSPTVRPPRLGGNKRMGVFATRSPYRPNPIGLSSVELVGIEKTAEGSVLVVRGADLMDKTPIYDIKPYLSFTDSHPDAKCGFADESFGKTLEVVFPPELLEKVPCEKRNILFEILSQDPRPAYIEDAERIYGFGFAGMEIKFKVEKNVLAVVDVLNNREA